MEAVSSIRNLRTRNAVVTGDPLNMEPKQSQSIIFYKVTADHNLYRKIRKLYKQKQNLKSICPSLEKTA
jgi:hypothetical protein